MNERDSHERRLTKARQAFGPTAASSLDVSRRAQAAGLGSTLASVLAGTNAPNTAGGTLAALRAADTIGRTGGAAGLGSTLASVLAGTNAPNTAGSTLAALRAADTIGRTGGAAGLGSAIARALARPDAYQPASGILPRPAVNPHNREREAEARFGKIGDEPDAQSATARDPVAERTAAPATRKRHESSQPVRTAADLGVLVRAARKSLALNQQDFADIAGVGRRFVSELEAGKPSLEFDKVLRCCAAAGIDILASPRRLA